jgi:hypothetical protein
LRKKNRRRLLQLEDPHNMTKLLQLPTTRVAKSSELKAQKPRKAARMVQAARAIEILHNTPLRVGNLASIEIGTHLLRLSDRHQLRFNASEMRARKPAENPVPAELTPYLDHDIGTVRPRLLAKAPADSPGTERLWISQYGLPLRERMLHTRISETTR